MQVDKENGYYNASIKSSLQDNDIFIVTYKYLTIVQLLNTVAFNIE